MKVTVRVKWGSETFPGVEVDSDQETEVLKAQLFALTNVPPDRQKVVFAGKRLGDSWDGIRLRNNMVVMLMGSADPIPEAPTEAELMEVEQTGTGEEANKSVMIPSGLINMGNTCYMNSVVQVFHQIPQLEKAIQAFDRSGSPEASLVRQLGLVLGKLSTSDGEPIFPSSLIQSLYSVFPDFKEMKEGSSVPMQQDAEECFSRLLSLLGRQLNPDAPENSLVHRLLGVQMKVQYSCVESDQEESTTSFETFFKLACHIQKDTTFLLNGVQQGLAEHITKYAPLLGRESVFQKTQRILRLPKILVVQMVRFYWKAGSGKKEGNRAKIVKPIQFPETLDVFDLCDDDLKGKLKVNRTILEMLEEKRLGVDKDEDKGEIPDPVKFEEDENDTGRYRLSAIITHQGYSAEGGHYVGWVRSGTEEKSEWYLFDDQKVSRHTLDTVKGLSRSTGDGPIPYLLVYSTIESDFSKKVPEAK